MRISLLSGSLATTRTPLLALPVLEAGRPALKGPLGDLLAEARATGDVAAAPGKDRLFHLRRRSGPARLLAMGAGKQRELDAEKLRAMAARAVARARELELGAVVLGVPAAALAGVDAFEAGRAVAEGLLLGAYRYRPPSREKSPEAKPSSASVGGEGRLPAAFREGFAFGSATAEAVLWARDLGNRPGNVVTPAALGREAMRLRAPGVRVRVFGERDLARFRMGALLGVAQGSDEEAKLIVLEYAPRGAKETVCVVGKGLTFDAGGISIKPSARMDEMRYDMCGGAAVLGLFHALRRLRPAVRVVGVVPSSENLLSGSAQKPGDVVRACDGTTIEVLNTDAEGRLILGDAIAWARKTYKPDAMVDLATLTGAAIVALGHEVTAVLGNDQKLVDALVAAGKAAGEPLWQLPLWDEHLEQMKSRFADLRNINSPNQGGGTIAGAAFLAHFAKGVAWAHLDIAGTAWGGRKRDYYQEGATGVGVRLLAEFLRARASGGRARTSRVRSPRGRRPAGSRSRRT